MLNFHDLSAISRIVCQSNGFMSFAEAKCFHCCALTLRATSKASFHCDNECFCDRSPLLCQRFQLLQTVQSCANCIVRIASSYTLRQNVFHSNRLKHRTNGTTCDHSCTRSCW